MVATVRCGEIANEKYSSFVKNKEWCELEDAVQSQLVPDFGKKISSLLDTCFAGTVLLEFIVGEILKCNFEVTADPTKGANKSSSSQDPLATSKWEQIPASKTLITPVQCRSLWSQFQKETEYAVSQAISAQESFTRAFEEKYQDLDTRPVDDPSLWEVVMPRKKGRIFGFGTSHNPMFAMTGTPSTLSNGHSYHFAPTPEVTQLQEALQAEREKREELERRSQELEQRSAEEIQSLQQRQATTENIVNQLLAQLRPNSDGPPLP